MSTALPGRAAPHLLSAEDGRAPMPLLPPGERRGEGAPADPRRGFTLVELLVTISIIVVLVALFGGAIAAGRKGVQASNSRNGLVRLDQIVMTQYRSYAARSVSPDVLKDVQQYLGTSGTSPSAARAWHIRRNMITADMPDRWSDVAYMASGTGVAYLDYDFPPGQSPVVSRTVFFPQTAAQATYVATYKAAVAAGKTPTNQYGGAECLFMIVMQGGFANCLDCNGLAQLKKGDKDNDGALEFWDDWDNPIDYILWAPGFLKSEGTTPFFNTTDNPLDLAFSGTGSVRAGLGMRPLIYSAGFDGQYGLERNGDAATLNRGSGPVGLDCGNPGDAVTMTSGSAAIGSGDARADNIVTIELQVGS